MKPRLIERMADKPHYVYRHFDSDGWLLYVGCTSQRKSGPRRHRNKPWWPDVARTTIDGPMDYWTAGQAEQRAIDTENPLWNIYANRIIGSLTFEQYQGWLEHSKLHRKAKEQGLPGAGVVIQCMSQNGLSADQAIGYLVRKQQRERQEAKSA